MKGKGKKIGASSSAAGKRKNLSAASSSSSAAAEAEASSSRRKKKRPGVLQFFDDAAVDADSDDEGEDDGWSDLEDEEPDIGPDFTNHTQRFKDIKGAGKLNPLPFVVKEEDLSGDELEELIKDRYGHGSEYISYHEDTKEFDDRVSDMHAMKDPTIWRVKCMVGCERKIAFSLMQKYIHLQEFGSKMQIISVFALDHVQGYVYIEAEKSSDISEACKGFCNLYWSRMGLLPRNEIPHLLSIRNKQCKVSERTWVRLKNGKYKGDLAQVVAVDNKQKKAMVKLVPRIDLHALAKKFGGGVSLKRAVVPTPRLISSHELENFRPHIQRRRDRQTGEVYDVLDGLMLKDGYLYKKVSFGALVFWSVQPSDAECLKFKDSSKDDAEDLSWISSVYDSRKKMQLDEKSDHNLEAEKRNGFDIHDLVLFGRKAFGVIIALDIDNFQVLKGDADDSEVVTVRVQEIKNGCIDKMFKASDYHLKTISINDVVKVLEGPLQGREGIVKHMYKGTLFIYDENQTENSGIFCVKSQLCQNVTESKDSFGEKSHKKSSSSFPQSPTSSFQQDDNDIGFDRCRQSNTNSIFSIGQTLRIRKGPLKGYLCRVVGIYRSDITVKLDSLVKVITVQEQFLSVPNLKRDDSACTASDALGTQEWQPFGGLPCDRTGAQADTSLWDGQLPSTGGDSWQGLSTSGLPSTANNDDKADQVQGGDPWGGKVTAARDHGFQSNQALENLGNAISSGDEQNLAWNKSTSGKKGIDDVSRRAGNWETGACGWDKASAKNASNANDGWEKAKPPSNDVSGSWANESFKNGGPLNNAICIWERPRANSQYDSLKNSDTGDGWDKAERGKGSILEQGSSCEDNNWGTAVKSQERNANESKDWGNQASVWDRVKDPSGGHSDNWNRAKDTNIYEKGSWDDKIEGSGDGPLEGWNEPRSSDCERASSWDRHKAPSGGQVESWGKAGDECQGEKGGWNKAGSTEGQSDDWNKQNKAGSTEGQIDGWNKPKAISTCSESNWDKANISSGWNEAGLCKQAQMDGWSKPRTYSGDEGSSWDNKSDNWSKAKDASDAEMGSWNKAGFSNQGQTGSWNKPKSFYDNKGPSWNRADDNEAHKSSHRDNWDKPRNFNGGSGFGRGRGRGRTDRGRGLGWGRGTGGRGEVDGNGDQENDWNQRRDSDGGGGFHHGRGRGWFGAGRNGDHDGSWRSGRGRGRGWNGSGERNDNFDDTRKFGHGRGRGLSSDWKNAQNNIGGSSFTGNPSSSWGVNQSGGWDKQQSFNKDEGSRGYDNQQGGWSRGKSFKGDSTFGWKIDPQDQASGWHKGIDISKESEGIVERSFDGKQSSDWNKVGGGAFSNNPSSFGGLNQSAKQPSDQSKDEVSNKWSSSKTSAENQCPHWIQGASVEDAGYGGNWNRSKPSASNHSSDWNNDKGDQQNAVKAFSGRWNSGQDDRSSQEETATHAVADGGGWDCKKSCAQRQSSGWMDNRSTAMNEAGKEVARCGWDLAKPSVGNTSPGGKNSSTQNDKVSGGEGKWDRPNSSDAVEPHSSGKTSCWTNDEEKYWNTSKDSPAIQSSVGGVGGNWDGSEPSGSKHSSGWNTVNPSIGSAGSAKNEADHAADKDNWYRGKLRSGGITDEVSNCHTLDAFGGGQSSDWKQQTSAGEAGEQAGVSGEHKWSRKKNFFDGKQSTGCNNDEGGWSKPKSFAGEQSSTWNDRSTYKEDRGGGDRWEGWNSGRSFGDDWSSGPRGNMFSSRGRGRGRNFGGGRGGRGADGNSFRFKAFDRGQSSGWNQGFTSGGNGDSGHHDSWGGVNDSSGHQPSGGEGSGAGGGWGAGGTAGKGSCGDWTKESAIEHKGSSGDGKGSVAGNWDQMKGMDKSRGSGWSGGSTSVANESTAGQADGWTQKKCSDNASGSGGWRVAGGSEVEDAWNRRNSSSGEQTSGWNQGTTKKGDAGGEQGSSAWEKGAGVSGGAGDGGGDKAGW